MNRKSSSLHVHDGVFDRNSPRPPVPGEERTHCVSDCTLPMEYPYSYKPRRKSSSLNEYTGDSKSVTSLTSASSSQRQQSENTSPPACLRWAVSLHCLLEDPDGVMLFKRFLQAEGNADALDFWLACEGLRKRSQPDPACEGLLKQSEPDRVVKVIYKRYFLKSSLPISEDIKREVGRCLKSSEDFKQFLTLFDAAQSQVENLINNTTYPIFLKSELYLQYIQSVQNPAGSSGDFSSESSSSSSSASNKDLTSLACGGNPLPIIHEDKEFHNASLFGALHQCQNAPLPGYQSPSIAHGPMRLTRNMLLATQKNRAMDVRPQTETFAADMYRGSGGLHLYNSYNPVSRQDSEKQSISSHSDARTESDNMSLTDSSIDGRSLHRSTRRKSASIEARMVRESAAINKETHMHQAVIPRTQRVDKQQVKPLMPDEFAAILIQKLETLKRSQDKHELLERKLSESDSLTSLNEKCRATNELQSRELANAIRELEDDNCQQILDDHVSIVFSDNTSHALSPGVTSPRPHSPRKYQSVRVRRKDKDGFSTFSGDSGNVHDFGEEHKMVKSKSMPEYPEERFGRGCATRRSSKKAPTEFTDSGVSVVSDTPPDSRVRLWLEESERGSRTSSYTHTEMSGSKHSRHRSTTSSTLPSSASRHRKNYGSRSNSLERSGASSTLCPAQPFVADPSMPPLPQPNTTIQLEEAIRRLNEGKDEDLRTRSKQSRTPCKHYTTVVFSFCEEQFPYRIKIPGKQVTLKQFKEFLPKKGNYRYFFKTECEELDNQVIQEEVSSDADVLPLWEGRISAQVKTID